MAAWGRSIAAWARTAVGPDHSGTADGELLTRFALSRDQAAFELIVWRHGGMVLRTALAVTRDHHAAEDVTQATFLVLAKRAASLRDGDALAGFLHTTARRIAIRAASRRRTVPLPEGLAAVAGPADDTAAAVHEEVARLPEVWRVPVLLCFFEGLTHAEAAARLGKPVGSVAGWVARAKDRLHDRLTRRGVTLPAAGLASLLAVGPADAKFVAAVSGSAIAYVSGSLVSSPEVLQLVHGAYRAMILAKLKVAATAGVIGLGGAGLTIGGWAYTTAQVPGGAPGAPTANKGPGATVTFVKPDETPKSATPEESRKITLAQVRRSQANLKKLIPGMHTYHDTYSKLPTDVVATDKAKTPLLSWRVAILPYIGEQKLYEQFKLDQPWDSESNLKLLSKMPDCLRVGFEAKDSTHTYYQVFHAPGAALFPIGADAGRGGGFGRGGPVGFALPPGTVSGSGGPVILAGPPGIASEPASPSIGTPTFSGITDGMSNTIGVAECGPPVPWTKPADIVVADLSKPLPQLAWPFQNGIMTGFMDGHFEAFNRNLTDPHLRAMITASNGEVLDDNLSRKFRLRLHATTAEEKAMLEKARVEMATTAKAVQAEAAEYFRLIQKSANDDLFDIEEITRDLKRNLADHIAKNKELATPKK